MKSISAFAIGLVTVCWTMVVTAAPISPQPVHTNKTRFRIPYRFDVAEMQRLRAKEIRLYVSFDHGVRWQHVQTVAPSAGRFDFEAQADGEYWFVVRTLDDQNRLHPQANATEPGLKVVVDTTPPTLEIKLRQSEAGKVQLSWVANDLHLDEGKLRLEYIQNDSSNWQPVSVVPQASGQTSWSVPAGGYVVVRGSVNDLAANVGHAQNQVRIAPAVQAIPKPAAPDFSQPIASNSTPSGTSQDFPEQFPNQQNSFANQPNNSAAELAPDPFASGSNSVESTTWPSFNSKGIGTSSANEQFVSDFSEKRPDVVQPRYPTPELSRSVPSAGARTRVVNTRKFQIAYKVEDVGPSGVASVELFITQNNGQKWYKYGNDPDTISPFEVEVPQDGIYGFALSVRSGAGLASDPPQPGSKPSIVVIVDKTPPVVRLAPARQGQGAALNKILIQWRVEDQHPIEKPIALSYSADPDGPWEMISGWQANTGRFVWALGPGLPSKLYIRLTARDAAGNITRAETKQPVIVDLSKPSARIVDVESVESSGVQ